MKIVLLLIIVNLIASLGDEGLKRYVVNVECGGLTKEQCDTKARKTIQEYCKTNDDKICKDYDIFDHKQASELEIDLSKVSECIDNYGFLTKCKCKVEVLDSATGQQGIICRDIKSNDKVTPSTAPPGFNTKEGMASSHASLTAPTTVANTYSTSVQNTTYLNKTIEAEFLRKHGWNETSNGVFYKLFYDWAAYTEARINCEQQKAVLASKTVRDSLSDIKSMLESGNITIWIGLNDIHTEETWVWEDGIISNATIPWNDGQPENSIEPSQDCAALRFGIFDAYCTNHYRYVCERTV